MGTYGLLGRRIIRYWPKLTQLVMLTALASFVTALTPWPVKLMVDSAFGDVAPPAWVVDLLQAAGFDSTPRTLVVVSAVALFIIASLNAIPDLLLGRNWADTGESLTRDLSEDLLHKRLRVPLSRHHAQPIGEAMVNINTDSYSIYTLADLTLVAPARELLTLISMAALSWTLSPRLTVITFVLVPVVVLLAESFGRNVKVQAAHKREVDGRFTTMIQRSLASLTIIQALELWVPQRRFDLLAERGVRVARRDQRAQLTFDAVTGGVLVISTAVVLVVGTRLVLDAQLTTGGLLVFLGYLAAIRVSVVALLGLWRSRQEIDPGVTRVGETLSTSGVTERPDARPLRMHPRGARIEFDRVTFGHEDGPPLLEDVSFVIEPGELVALVGPTGTGKSTLVSLIPRLLDPWSGRVLINGQDITDVTVASLRANIAVVLQDPYLFPVSVAENVAYGRPDATRREVIHALEVAGAAEFVARLPRGIDTVIGERGATLSGGERQRLSIARALIRRSPIVLLDEPTSALDPHTEHEVMDAIEILARGRTTLLISHRPSTIARADRVLAIGPIDAEPVMGYQR